MRSAKKHRKYDHLSVEAKNRLCHELSLKTLNEGSRPFSPTDFRTGDEVTTFCIDYEDGKRLRHHDLTGTVCDYNSSIDAVAIRIPDYEAFATILRPPGIKDWLATRHVTCKKRDGSSESIGLEVVVSDKKGEMTPVMQLIPDAGPLVQVANDMKFKYREGFTEITSGEHAGKFVGEFKDARGDFHLAPKVPLEYIKKSDCFRIADSKDNITWTKPRLLNLENLDLAQIDHVRVFVPDQFREIQVPRIHVRHSLTARCSFPPLRFPDDAAVDVLHNTDNPSLVGCSGVFVKRTVEAIPTAMENQYHEVRREGSNFTAIIDGAVSRKTIVQFKSRADGKTRSAVGASLAAVEEASEVHLEDEDDQIEITSRAGGATIDDIVDIASIRAGGQAGNLVRAGTTPEHRSDFDPIQREWLSIIADELLHAASHQVTAEEQHAFSASFCKGDECKFWIEVEKDRAPHHFDIVSVRDCLAVVVKAVRSTNDRYAVLTLHFLDHLPRPRDFSRYGLYSYIYVPFVVLAKGRTSHRAFYAVIGYKKRAPEFLREGIEYAVNDVFSFNMKHTWSTRTKEYKDQLEQESEFLAGLRINQYGAAKRAMRMPLAIIQGPPGTGKTHMAAKYGGHILDSAVRARRIVNDRKFAAAAGSPNPPVIEPHPALLATADSNAAADNLFRAFVQQLKGTYLAKNILRFQAPEKRSETSTSKFPESCKFDDARIIVTTASSAGHDELRASKKWFFFGIIIDEAAQCLEVSSIIPIMRSSMIRNVTLFGDHCQLPPTVRSELPAISLYARLRANGFSPMMLTVQSRMHPLISNFPSRKFYDKRLEDLDQDWEEARPLLSPFKELSPNDVANKRVLFVNSDPSQEDKLDNSKFNLHEASMVFDLLHSIKKACSPYHPPSIGVITMYAAQKQKLRESLGSEIMKACDSKDGDDMEFWDGIRISSVDAFQGSEEDIIIISTVRANDQQKMGFVNDSRRMNVALTRARNHVVVMGSARTMKGSDLWSDWLQSGASTVRLEQFRPPPPPPSVLLQTDARRMLPPIPPNVRSAPPVVPFSGPANRLE